MIGKCIRLRAYHELHPSPSKVRKWEVLPRPYFLLKVYLHRDKGTKSWPFPAPYAYHPLIVPVDGLGQGVTSLRHLRTG
jgi:hypothetical protein